VSNGVTFNTALAASSALVALAFGLSTWDRWLRRRRAHDLAWSIAMALFALGALSLWWAEARGWSANSFRFFFLFGALTNVPWLALGTVYLLAGERIGDAVRTGVVLFTGVCAGVCWTAPTKTQVVHDEFPTAKTLFGVVPRVLAAVGSGVPALVIFAGAVWSAVTLLRGHTPTLTHDARRRVVSHRKLSLGNILIAVGTLVLSASGTFAGRLGQDRAFAVTLLVGIAILYAGFFVSGMATQISQGERSATARLLNEGRSAAVSL
jgi:hypothetical protein